MTSSCGARGSGEDVRNRPGDSWSIDSAVNFCDRYPREKRIGALHSRNKNVVVVVVVDSNDAVNVNGGTVSPSTCVRLRVHRVQCQGDRLLPVAERRHDSQGEEPAGETDGDCDYASRELINGAR